MSRSAISGAQSAALRRMPSSGEQPQARPRWTQRLTLERLLAAGLIEEPSPGLYRRTAAGDAALRELLGAAARPGEAS